MDFKVLSRHENDSKALYSLPRRNDFSFMFTETGGENQVQRTRRR
jgi:hypothetical protein